MTATCFLSCMRQGGEDSSGAGRCILCGENKCSGCSALLQHEYRQRSALKRAKRRPPDPDDIPERSPRLATRGHGGASVVHGQYSRQSIPPAKKDACFYSHGTVSSGMPDDDDEDGRAPGAHYRNVAGGHHHRLQVWFREPMICREADGTKIFVPQEFTEYEFCLQWGERRWVVRR